MTELLLISTVVAGGAALFGFTMWLERAAHRPGLAQLIGAVVMLVVGGMSLLSGNRLLAVIFAVQAALFLYTAYWRHLTARQKQPTFERSDDA